MNHHGRFASTRWTLVVRSADFGDDRAARQALAELCALYWPPLYAFARRRGLAEEDAADRVQGFFVTLFEGTGLAAADPGRGRFRSYLLGAFRHYLSTQRRREAALKRGGGAAPVSLDGPALEGEEGRMLEVAGGLTPEEVYERRWALQLLELVLRRLRREYQRLGKSELFAALEPLLTGDAGRGSAQEIARRLGSSPGAVRVATHRLRRRFAELLRHEVSQTVASRDDVEAELRHLANLFAG